MARLVVEQGGERTSHELLGDGLRVGSGGGCQVVLRDPEVAREHLEVKRQGGAWKLVDLESASGTKVNGLYVNSRDLVDGDVITAGDTRIVFEAGGARATPMPPAAAPVASAPVVAPPTPVAPAPAARPVVSATPAVRGSRAPASGNTGGARLRRKEKTGLEGWILVGMIGIAGLMILLTFSGAFRGEDMPNYALSLRMKELNKAGRHAEVLELAGEADASEATYYQLVREQLDLARNTLEGTRLAALEEESIRFQEWNIRKWHQEHRHDDQGLIQRYDEYLARFPGSSMWNDIAERRLKLAGAPSPVALAVERGEEPPLPGAAEDGDAGSAALGEVAKLLKAAGDEAERLAAKRQFGDSISVYERFLENSAPRLAGSDREAFELELKSRIEKLHRRAAQAFEKLELEAFDLMEKGDWSKADRMYKQAARDFGIDEIVDRCKSAIDQIRRERD